MGIESNKILLPLNNSTVIQTAVQPFNNPDKFQKIIITHSPEDKNTLESLFAKNTVPVVLVEGGSTRQKSVCNGLKHLFTDNPQIVLIHDGARPWISEALIDSVLEKAESEGSAVPVIPSVNAMKKINGDGKIIEHLQREKTISAQTPQGFLFEKILQAHERAEAEAFTAIDDTELWDRYFGKVSTVSGEISNIKITYKKDLEGK